MILGFKNVNLFQGYYYLFYSSGWYSDPHYNVRVAKSKSPTGPFIKKKFPVLETNWIPYNQVKIIHVHHVRNHQCMFLIKGSEYDIRWTRSLFSGE